jgi:hypothetical protein
MFGFNANGLFISCHGACVTMDKRIDLHPPENDEAGAGGFAGSF